MKHTYLFEEGKWYAEGFYCDDTVGEVRIESYPVIKHTDDLWILDGSMKLLLDDPVEFTNTYEIVPFQGDSDLTSWKSYNPALGELKGSFMIVGDSILSKYASADGKYSGFEYLKQIDDTTYENRGFAFIDESKLSSWSVLLKKIR